MNTTGPTNREKPVQCHATRWDEDVWHAPTHTHDTFPTMQHFFSCYREGESILDTSERRASAGRNRAEHF